MPRNESLNQPEMSSSVRDVIEMGRPVLEHFNVAGDPVAEPEVFLRALQEVDPRYEGERNLVRFELEQDQTKWSQAAKTAIMVSAESMGMLKPETPPEGKFDTVIVLGGARRAPLDRLKYAAQAVRSGAVQTKEIIAVGSARPLLDAEKEMTADYAPGAQTEFDLVRGAIEKVQLETEVDYIVEVVGLGIRSESANTELALESVLNSRKLSNGGKIAGVTTQIYRLATAIDFMRVGNKHGVETFVAGNPSDPEIIAARTPATYLSEVLRTIRAAAQAL